jgi:hypothetical protein
MNSNPYESPVATDAGQSARRLSLWRQKLVALVKRFPVTTAALTFAVIVTLIFFVREYGRQQQMARDGGIMTERSPLDVLMTPGLFFALVVVYATESGVAACVACMLGMLTAYGVPGLVIDGFRNSLGVKEPRMKAKDVPKWPSKRG